ncbi:hypothetical protein NSZ01_24580 [Nocardioides szechwanensis]|uniref:SDR family NAD(P)-dependent oxidoreductase n=1 Tax=Nocardioides szechwanensis TaxID=1005944 RepID=UPI001194AD40|nr:hypothetical protein NSZ01_24580 [Nocardioides szechwanensis]
MSDWRLDAVPDQSGRTILVTGTTVGGLGHHTALELARRGARVILAGRTESKIAETDEAIHGEVPDAELERLTVDVSDLASVRRAAGDAAAFARSTYSSTTPASWARPTPAPPTVSSSSSRPTTSARSC